MYNYFRHLLVFFALLSTVIFSISSGFAHAEMLSIAKDGVNMRSGPGTKYEIKWEYGEGFPLRVVSKKGDWIKVKDFENDTGWVFKSLLTPESHMIVKVNKKRNKKVNIRSGPGTNFKVVGKAYYGVVFKTLEQKSGWAKVKHDTGLEGWIKRSLLWGF